MFYKPPSQISYPIIKNQKPKQVILDGFGVIFYESLTDANKYDTLTHNNMLVFIMSCRMDCPTGHAFRFMEKL